MALSDSVDCARRSTEHFEAGIALSELETPGRDWAAVAFFYAAYHAVRGAMLNDPVFSDASRLAAINVRLTMGDRRASHHQARTGGPLGLREIVPMIYPQIRGRYAGLHQASIDVRYGHTLVAPIADLYAKSQDIITLAEAGQLVAK